VYNEKLLGDDDHVDWSAVVDYVGSLTSAPHDTSSILSTPSLSEASTLSSSESSEHSNAFRGRKLGHKAFQGTVISWHGGVGCIKALSGTRYAFELGDMITKIDRSHLVSGMPVLFDATIDQAILRAVTIKINWTKILIRSYDWAWHGPRIPMDQISLDGRCLTWARSGRGLIEVGESAWRTNFELDASDVPLDQVDRATLCCAFPVQIDLVRDRRSLSNLFRAAALRTSWRSLLDVYCQRLAAQGQLEARDALAQVRPSRTTTGKNRSLRPTPATISLMPDGKDCGYIRPVGAEQRQVAFHSTTIFPRSSTSFKLGQRVFYWTASDPDHAVALLARPEGDLWPSVMIS